MTDKRCEQDATGLAKATTVVVETSVYGVVAYHARCCECGWESKRFDRERTAAAHGKQHGAFHVQPA